MSQKVAIVTGGSRGIGAAIARRLSSEGCIVVINYSGSAADAERVAADIERTAGHAVTVHADVSEPAAVTRLFDTVEASFGGVDVLVNNAGIMKLARLAECDDALFEQHVSINLKGTFNTLREAARRLRHGGRIVNLSASIVGLKLETYGVYAATKAAVETLTAILSKELRGRSITVNAVAPGPTASDVFLDGKSQALIDHISKTNPLQRLGTPADIAAVVGFLIGPDGGWVNGQVLRANGGII